MKVHAIAAGIGLILLATQAALADPMKCSGEEKTCITNCSKFARTTVANCLEACRVSRLICLRTGCWDSGTSRYCGLMKQ
jgi:hypothetical protein